MISSATRRGINPSLPLLLALILCALPAAAEAYTQYFEIQRCALLPGDKERLECYDNFSRKLGLPTSSSDGALATTQTEHGRWVARTESTGPDDPASVYAFTLSEDQFETGDGVVTRPLLATRCHGGVTEIFLAFPTPSQITPALFDASILYSRTSRSKEVKPLGRKTIMIGQEKEATKAPPKKKARITFDNMHKADFDLTPSLDARAWFFPNPVSIIRRVERHKRITIESVQSGPESAIEFSMEGLEEAILPLRRACNW